MAWKPRTAPVEEMAVAYVAEIRALQPHGPYMIAGECIGGILAYEMARHAGIPGEKVDPLVLLDTERLPEPKLRRWFQAKERSEKRRAILEGPHSPAREGTFGRSGSASLLEQKVSYIAQRVFPAWTANGHPKIPIPRMNGNCLPTIRWLLMEHTLQTLRRPGHPPHQRRTSTPPTMSLGWDKVPVGGLDIHVVPGDHMSYIREHAATAAAKLRELIDRAQLPKP